MIYFRLETGMRLDFIPVSKFRTNKLYNCLQCRYIVYITKYYMLHIN